MDGGMIQRSCRRADGAPWTWSERLCPLHLDNCGQCLAGPASARQLEPAEGKVHWSPKRCHDVESVGSPSAQTILSMVNGGEPVGVMPRSFRICLSGQAGRRHCG